MPSTTHQPPLSLPPPLPLLAPLLSHPPDSSLLLITGVQDATTNWVLARLLIELARPPPQPSSEPIIVFASFLRDWAFWSSLTRRVGLDLPHLRAAQRLVFVDGLTGLFSREGEGARGVLSWKGDAALVVRDLEGVVREVASGAKERKVVLVLDALDLLLAAGAVEPLAVLDLLDALLGLREHVHSTTIALHAATPFLAPPAPLDVAAATLLAALAGQARAVLSLRPLPSGAAVDASGFLRVTRGGAAGCGEGEGDEDRVEEMEALFFVARDSRVQIYKRPGMGG